jgi:hypothetical protein
MAHPRSWTDEDLYAAVASSSTWNEVVARIGRKRVTRKGRLTVQGHALRLGLDASHLPAMDADAKPLRPDWVRAADEELTEAVSQSTTWAEVFRRLDRRVTGSGYIAFQQRAETLGLDTSHFRGQAWSSRPIEGQTIPFSRPPSLEHLPKTAVALASAWFLERGYRVSVPTEPAPYDLVVESDDGFARVQVKSTSTRELGRWTAHISRREYTPGILNAGGARKDRTYKDTEIDYFFIVTGDGSHYIIPLKATNGIGRITLDSKYGAFRVQLWKVNLLGAGLAR